MDVLPDVKTLNTIVKYGLEGLVLSIYPPWLFPDESLIGRLKLKPGARNVYDPSISGEIKALQGKGEFGIEQAKEQELRQAIAQGFLDDVLGLREEGANITATEVLDRRERRQQITGPAVARAETELLDPLVETCWMMMFRAGAFGPPPEALLQAESIEIDFILRRTAGSRVLSRSEDEATRKNVILNPFTPYDVLSELENQFTELFVNNPALESPEDGVCPVAAGCVRTDPAIGNIVPRHVGSLRLRSDRAGHPG